MGRITHQQNKITLNVQFCLQCAVCNVSCTGHQGCIFFILWWKPQSEVFTFCGNLCQDQFYLGQDFNITSVSQIFKGVRMTIFIQKLSELGSNCSQYNSCVPPEAVHLFQPGSHQWTLPSPLNSTWRGCILSVLCVIIFPADGSPGCKDDRDMERQVFRRRYGQMCLYYVSTRSAVTAVICCKQVSPEDTSRPGQSQGLLYEHLRNYSNDSFIQ